MQEWFVVYRWSNNGPVAICETWSMQRGMEIASRFQADYPDESYYVVVESR